MSNVEPIYHMILSFNCIFQKSSLLWFVFNLLACHSNSPLRISPGENYVTKGKTSRIITHLFLLFLLFCLCFDRCIHFHSMFNKKSKPCLIEFNVSSKIQLPFISSLYNLSWHVHIEMKYIWHDLKLRCLERKPKKVKWKL